MARYVGLTRATLFPGRPGKRNYDPSRQLYNWHSGNTAKWRAALAQAPFASRPAVVVCLGDSTTAGFIDSVPGVVTARSNALSWPSMLRDMLQVRFGPSGPGVSWSRESDNAIVYAGTWADQPYGPSAVNCRRAGGATTHTATLTARCTAFRVTYLTANGGGVFRFVVDGTTTTTQNTDMSLDTKVVTVTAGAYGVHTIVVSPDSSTGQLFLIGIEPITTGGVRVLNNATGSTTAKILIDSNNNNSTSLKAAIDLQSPDLTIIAHGANSAGAQPLVDYKADIQTLITRAKTYGDVMLCTTLHWATDTSMSPQQSRYDEALYELADANDVPLFDLAARWGGLHSTAPAAFYSGPIHGTAAGHYDYAAGVFAAIMTGYTGLDAEVSPTFVQRRTSVTWSQASGLTNFGAWTSQGGYVGTATGVQVPRDGTYLVQVSFQAGAAFTARTILQVMANGSSVGRGSVDSSVGEDEITATVVTPYLLAGQEISPWRYHNAAGVTYTGNLTMRIVRLHSL